jgi:hypothetical protein
VINITINFKPCSATANCGVIACLPQGQAGRQDDEDCSTPCVCATQRQFSSVFPAYFVVIPLCLLQGHAGMEERAAAGLMLHAQYVMFISFTSALFVSAAGPGRQAGGRGPQQAGRYVQHALCVRNTTF